MKTTTHPQQTPTTPLRVSQSFRAFLERHYDDSRVARLLHIASTVELPAARLLTTDALDYLTNRTNGLISYLPKGKPLRLNDDGLWARTNRQEAKPARVINRLLSPKALRLLKESELEYFASLYGAFTVMSTYTRVQHVHGEAIVDVYNNQNHSFTSCMKNVEPYYFDIYTQNPDVVGCLAMYDWRCDSNDNYNNHDNHPRLLARALTWKIDGTTYTDRIYGESMDAVEYLKSYAQEQGFMVKTRQVMDEKTSWQKPDGTRFEKLLSVNLNTNFDYFPYMDTFTWGNDGWLANYDRTDWRHKYTCTEGDRFEYITDIDGNFRPENDCHWSDYHNGYVYSGDAVELNGDYYHERVLRPVTVIRTPDGSQFTADECSYANGYRLPDDHGEDSDYYPTDTWRRLDRAL